MKYENLADFWPAFLSAHLHPWNRRFHIIGNIVMLSCWVAFAITLDWRFLVLSLVGYIPSWLGHLFFEGKHPPTFGYPLLSAAANYKMVGLMLAGAMPDELERLFGSRTPKTHSEIRVSREAERAYQEKLRFHVGQAVPRHPFQSYWEIFVLKHQKPLNIWVHAFAMYYLYAVVLAAIYLRNPQILFAIPLAQLSGLVAHRFVEPTHIDFEDAIFSPRAFYCLNRMMVGVLTGAYWKELARVRGELAEFLTHKRA